MNFVVLKLPKHRLSSVDISSMNTNRHSFRSKVKGLFSIYPLYFHNIQNTVELRTN